MLSDLSLIFKSSGGEGGHCFCLHLHREHAGLTARLQPKQFSMIFGTLHTITLSLHYDRKQPRLRIVGKATYHVINTCVFGVCVCWSRVAPACTAGHRGRGNHTSQCCLELNTIIEQFSLGNHQFSGAILHYLSISIENSARK